MSWNLSKREFEKLKTEFQEEISNSNFGFNLGEISEKLQNLLLNRAFTNLFYDESLYICSQGRLHPNNPKIQNIVGCFLDFANRNCREYELATEHLNEMNKKSKDLPWNLSFSYGRALQQPSLSKWLGKNENIQIAQEALFQRSQFNSEATSGKYNSENENKI